MAEHKRVKVLSAADLMPYRNKTKTLPTMSCKNVTVPKSDVNKLKETFLEVFKEERTQKLGDLLSADYNSEDGSIVLRQIMGNVTRNMGYYLNNRKFLYPEEALFLMESSQLELYQDYLPVSIQEAYQLLLNKRCTLEEYQAYSHLSRLGYSVLRHHEDKPVNTNQFAFLTGKRSIDDDELSNANSKKLKFDDGVFDFPECTGHGYLRFEIPPEGLLPPNISVTPEMCFKTRSRISADVNTTKEPRTRKRCRPKKQNEINRSIFPTGIIAESWLEFKQKLKNLDSSSGHLDEPESAAALPHSRQNLIKAIEPLEEEPDIKKSTSKKVKYDVFLPSEKYPKTSSHPNHRLTVANVRDSAMNLYEIFKMGEQDGVPLHFAVNDCGQTAFYSMNRIDIPTLKSTL